MTLTTVINGLGTPVFLTYVPQVCPRTRLSWHAREVIEVELDLARFGRIKEEHPPPPTVPRLGASRRRPC
jgi:hypothetical protein